jgi:hypothetical protein
MLGWMRRHLGFGVAWIGATALSIAIAAAAVAGIRDRVVDKPVAIGLPTTTTTAPPVETAPATSSPDPSITSVAPATSTTTSTSAPEPATTANASPEVTTTTAPAATSTTAAPATTTTSGPSYATYDLVGGTVVLAVVDGEIQIAGATPRTGFTVHYDEKGPSEVEVEFVGEDHKSTLEAHLEGGMLEVSTHEDGEGEDDHGDDGGGGERDN